MKLKPDSRNARTVGIAVRKALLPAAAVAAALTAALNSTAVFAADDELAEVIVTGSILRRTDTETASPVTVLTAETMQDRGVNTIAEAVQRLTSNNAGTITQGWNTGWNFASGAVAPALRGLTVQNTLSIADGLRLAPYPLADDGQRNFVDLSSIPSAIVDRVEVLLDGASSTYGADAIAGVVNIITKKEIQGFEVRGSYGVSQEGDGEESTGSLTWGLGDLASDGYNFYISGEFKKQGEVWARDRSAPYNTADWQDICGPSGSCMANLNWNGVTAETGLFNGLISIPGVTLIRPITTATGTAGSGRFQYLNPSAGCREWPTVAITATQSTTSPLNVCEVNFPEAYFMFQPAQERLGLSTRFTANVNDNTQFYTMLNYYKTDTDFQITPLGLNGQTAAPGATAYDTVLPVYVCSAGIGTPNAVGTGCDATNGTLNPYNPFAAAGQRAQIRVRNPNPRSGSTSAQTLRGAAAVEGTFGSENDWRYSVDLTASQVKLTRTDNNYFIPQRLFDVFAQGTFNLNDLSANSAEIWQYVAPTSQKTSTSQLWQTQAYVAKDLFMLPGGPLQAALGAAYREESIDDASANPANPTAPYQRYVSINAVGTQGSRNVRSGFFEVSAPVHDMVMIDLSGRYDDYSTGQDNFSPKVGLKFKPFEWLAVRGTWSQGFRIPSFNESFGLPTTGYVSRSVDCAQFAAWCASHGNGAYATQSYNLGLTQIGNEELEPEESESFTVGLVFQPLANLSFTIDYFNIEVENLITGVTDTSEAEDQYYANNGVVNIPGINVVPGAPNVAFPNALPVIGFVESSFTNQDRQKVSGIDFGVNYSQPIGAVLWRSAIEASYLEELQLVTDAGDVFNYEGTLSPCNITSCSGAPQWRVVFQNTVEFGQVTATLTGNFTKGYDTASLDYGGIAGDCQGNADSHVSTASYEDGTPVNCFSPDITSWDLTARYAFSENLMVQADFLNVFDQGAKFDPSGGYGLYGFNPAWSGSNIMGRFFRIGASYKF